MVPINNKALNYNYQGVMGYIFKLNCSKSLPMQQHKYIFMWASKMYSQLGDTIYIFKSYYLYLNIICLYIYTLVLYVYSLV